MNKKIQRVLAAWAAVLIGPALHAAGGVTNVVPWSESFETYTNGAPITGTNGWRAETVAGGVVSTAAGVTAALTNYPVEGRTFPLASATHTAVLEVASQVLNDTRSAAGGVVALEFMVLPTWMDSPPAGDTNVQYSLCVSTNARLTVWHRNATLGTNEWLELTNSPAIATGVWARLTVLHDYSNRLFQVRVNEGEPVADSAGWTAGGAAAGGSWYRMVQTNAALAGFTIGAAPAHVDDLLVTNRGLAWAGAGFVERAQNDGRMDPAPVVLTLAYDTFTGVDGEDLAANGKATVTGVPAGLTAVVTRASATQVTLTLAGAAPVHEAADSLGDLAVRFEDGAFAFGAAWDVAGRQATNLTVAFLDTPRLAWSTNRFGETAANDGTPDNSAPLLVTLTNGTFDGAGGEDFTARASIGNLPPGLTGAVQVVSPTLLQVRLLGRAPAHDAADDTNVTFSLLDGAFTGVPASSVFSNHAVVRIAYTDPSALAYGTTVFAEQAANDGSVGGTTVTLSNKTFAAAPGDDLVAAAKAAVANLPAGLGLQVRCETPTQATVLFTGRAAAHAATNTLADLGLAFADSAFTGGNAAGVAQAVRTDLTVQFSDPPVVAAPGRTFAESAANNGTIGNTLGVTVSGDTFAAVAFAEGVHYTVANVPAGLAFTLARTGATQATASLGGSAPAHTLADSRGNLRLTFLDAAFATVAASNIAGQPLDFAVTYRDAPVLAYSGLAFHEVSAGYIDNRAPVAVTLAGETLAGADGQDFVAAGWLAVGNLPAGLAAQATRDGEASLSVRLTGAAQAHAASNSVTNVTFTFEAGAFAHVAPGLVVNSGQVGATVTFVDDTGFVNVIPYEEPFEAYANGQWLPGTNGWTAETFADAAVVTNEPAATSNLLAYLAAGHSQLPVATPHAQVLYVRDTVETAVRSEAATRAYVDFMTLPVALQAPPEAGTNLQYAFYVSTNRQLVVWHRNRTGAPVNEWMTLTNAGTIDTSRWVRFTVAHDYDHQMFQIQVDEARPVDDPRGWTEGGLGANGSWFHMVQTNGSLSGLRMAGSGGAYLDDLTVRFSLPELFGCRAGAVFKIR